MNHVMLHPVLVWVLCLFPYRDTEQILACFVRIA